MKKLKGPDLKLSEMKMPTVLADVYWDLRERRLLPLVALIVVAAVAVPFLLGEDAEESLPPSAAGAPLTAEAQRTDSATLTVVEAKPGLRDYRKRLKRLEKKNPFKPKFTGPMLKGSELNPQTEPSSGDSAPPGSPVYVPGKSEGGSPSGRHGELRLFAYAINVKITKQGGNDASGKSEEPVVKRHILPQTPLPGEKTPVVTFMGPGRTEDNKATGRALLLVSNEVKSVFGEAKCVSGEEVCQLLEVEPGFPVTFVYGENEVRYTINVLKLELIVIARKKYSREVQILLP